MQASAAARRSRAALLVVALGASLATMDLAVNVAFPSISAAFALDTPQIRWLVVCYVLTYASLMLAFGRLGDAIGHRRVFRAGLIVAVAAYTACAAADDYAWLLVARVAQGVSTALLLSCAPALATLLFAEAERTRVLGTYASLSALASIVAPVLGGISIAALGWAGVFWFRVPLAALGLVLLPLVPRLEGVRPALALRAASIAGSTLLAAGLALVLLGATLVVSPAHFDLGAGAALLGAAALVGFARRERKAQRPLMPRAVLANPEFVTMNVLSVAAHFAVFAVPLLAPYYLERVAGLTALASGCALAASPVGVLLGSAFAAKAVRTIGARAALLAGAAAALLGQVAIALAALPQTLSALLAALALQGLGLGIFQVAYTDSAVAALPRADRGVAGSLTILTRTIGVTTAAAALTALLAVFETRHVGAGAAAETAFVLAFREVFFCTAVLLALACAAAWMSRRT